MPLPRIGLSTYSRKEDEKGRFTLYAQYVDGVRRAGGLPLLLPPGALREAETEELLELVDGWVLTGGGDVDPGLYAGERHPRIYNTDPDRDEAELTLIRAILRGKRPALCICRGMQLLNVGLGGSLIGHLPDGDEVEGMVHRTPTRRPLPHPVNVTPRSRLASILGETELSPQSWHHQALDRVAEGFEVVARAPDGIVEGIESPHHPNLICVQWHPELTCADEPPQQRLFDALIAMCGQEGG